MVSKPKVSFPSRPELYAASPVPNLSDWASLWTAWDTVTRQMIPEEGLLDKPIKLRNACIFYLGHIPTFLDIHLTHTTHRSPTEPKYYPQIFERGIDPDVDNPGLCHAHSEIPDSWPPVDEIIAFQKRVRQRVESLYSSKAAQIDLKVGRALWLGYEHEIMHLETLLYMLVQSQKTLPPLGTIAPDFEMLARQAMASAVPNEWFEIPECDISLGLEDPENDEGLDRYFGWDNEKPKRSVHVGAFLAKARPITNGEYAQYLERTGSDRLPASWCEGSVANGKTNGHADGASNDHANSSLCGTEGGDASLEHHLHGKSVRTVYGNVSLEYALDWPVFASYDELVGCAEWMGGRIPTMEEVRSIYAYVDRMKMKDAENALGKTIPAVNG